MALANDDARSGSLTPWSAVPDRPGFAAGAGDLGVVVSMSHWKVKVHRASCSCYQQASRRVTAVSPGMAIEGCGRCRPTDEEIDRLIPLLTMYRYANGFGGGSRVVIPEIGG